MRHAIVLAMIGALSVSGVRAEEPVAGKQVEQELGLKDGQAISYLLYLPKDYTAGSRSWPLMLFLHGRGESQGPLRNVKKWGPPRLIEQGESFRYIIASPQCPPAPESWSQPRQQARLLELLEFLTQRFKVDTDRIYLTGLSMGGYGSWRLAADHPDRFAAVVPICGGGRPADAERLKWLPIWVWHGAADPVVPLKNSADMVDALRQAGSTTIQFTTLEGIGHNSWEAAYASPDLYQWLDKQTATKNRQRANSAAP